MYTNLLKRQINKYLKDPNHVHLDYKDLLEAINRSYEHYERDHQLGKQSLEISTAELRQLVLELGDKEARMRAILEAASEGILVINENDEIELCNSSAVKYLGLKKELQENNIDNVKIDIKDTELMNENIHSLADFFAVARLDTLYEVNIDQEDGSFLPFEISLAELTLSEKRLKICVLRNISKRKQYEKNISVRHEVSRILLVSATLEEAGPKILSRLCHELGWDIGCFFLKDLKENVFRAVFNYSTEEITNLEQFFKKTNELKLTESQGIEGIIWKTQEPCFYSNIYEGQNFIRKSEAFAIALKSYMGLPIYFEKEVIGVIELFSRKTQQKDLQQIRILRDIGSEVGMFIEHQNAMARESNLQKELIVAARQAGMMQVATSVLHNVGNALNSVNVSASALNEIFTSSELQNLPKIGDMIQQNMHDFANFITKDLKGKHLLNYLLAMVDTWEKDREKTQKEISHLTKNISHIKNIIKMQQSLSGMIGVREKVSINHLLDELVVMNASQFERFQINVKSDFSPLPEVIVDRCTLLQILENLIHNAMDALKVKQSSQRALIFRTRMKDQETIQIDVIDDGCGIDPDHLAKIFNFGFTTKSEGHGYGLHICALLAKEMGGQLIATSAGKGKGATFSLTVPIKTNSYLFHVA